MDVLFCLALDGYLAGTGELGDGGQEVLKADGWFFIPAFSPTLTNSCTSVRERICSLLLLFFIHTATKAIVEYLHLKEEILKNVYIFHLCSWKTQQLSYFCTSDFILHFQGDLSRSPSKLLSQHTMFPLRRSQLLLSCILLVALVQLPWSESRPATERTDTGETLHRCQPVKLA